MGTVVAAAATPDEAVDLLSRYADRHFVIEHKRLPPPAAAVANAERLGLKPPGSIVEITVSIRITKAQALYGSARVPESQARTGLLEALGNLAWAIEDFEGMS